MTTSLAFQTLHKHLAPTGWRIPFFALACFVLMILAGAPSHAASLTEMSNDAGSSSITTWPPKEPAKGDAAQPANAGSSAAPVTVSTGNLGTPSPGEASGTGQPAEQGSQPPANQGAAQENTPPEGSQNNGQNDATAGSASGNSSDNSSGSASGNSSGNASGSSSGPSKVFFHDAPPVSSVPTITPSTALRDAPQGTRNATMGPTSEPIPSWSTNATRALVGYEGDRKPSPDSSTMPRLKPLK